MKYVLEKPPSSPQELRFVAVEFVNCLYQDDRPLFWEADFSGFKRFHSSNKHCLDEASQYYRNWSASITRMKAVPYPLEFIQVMVVVAVTEGEFHLVVFCLLAYAGLFRLGELFNLRLRQGDIVSDGFCIVTS